MPKIRYGDYVTVAVRAANASKARGVGDGQIDKHDPRMMIYRDRVGPYSEVFRNPTLRRLYNACHGGQKGVDKLTNKRFAALVGQLDGDKKHELEKVAGRIKKGEPLRASHFVGAFSVKSIDPLLKPRKNEVTPGRADRLLRENFGHLFQDDRKSKAPCQDVIQFVDRATMNELVGDDGTLGMCSPERGKIYVRNDKIDNTVVHELVHYYSSTECVQLPTALIEGITEYIAQTICPYNITNHEKTYIKEVELVRKLVEILDRKNDSNGDISADKIDTGRDILLKAYFTGGSAMIELKDAIDRKLGDGAFLDFCGEMRKENTLIAGEILSGRRDDFYIDPDIWLTRGEVAKIVNSVAVPRGGRELGEEWVKEKHLNGEMGDHVLFEGFLASNPRGDERLGTPFSRGVTEYLTRKQEGVDRSHRDDIDPDHELAPFVLAIAAARQLVQELVKLVGEEAVLRAYYSDVGKKDLAKLMLAKTNWKGEAHELLAEFEEKLNRWEFEEAAALIEPRRVAARG